MPMLRRCNVPGCETLTLSPYCFEHEQLIVTLDSERAQAAVGDEPMVREFANVAELPTAATA
jgi:hypothetical protein